MEKGHLEAACLEPSWTVPYAFLPSSDFNLYPFPVMHCDHKDNIFQWVLWIIKIEGDSENPPKPAVEDGLMWAVPSNFIVG